MKKRRRVRTFEIAGLKISDPDVVAVLRTVRRLDQFNQDRVLSFASWLCQREILGLNASATPVQGANQWAECRKANPCSTRLLADRKDIAPKLSVRPL